VVGWVTAYLVLRVIFAREMRPEAGEHVLDSAVAGPLPPRSKQLLALMLISVGAYPALSYAGGPVWVVSTISAFLAGLLCWRHRLASPGRLVAGLSWDILVCLFCVLILVYGLRNVGLVERISALYLSVADPAWQIVLIGTSSALGSAVLNNHPMALLNALAIQDLPGGTQKHVLSALIGGDLGPRLLPMGSLAGLLWLESMRAADLHVGLSRFILVGASITIPTLALSLIVLLLL
jgi:arsenical pump membrane protein